jgi:hypothetical protein
MGGFNINIRGRRNLVFEYTILELVDKLILKILL